MLRPDVEVTSEGADHAAPDAYLASPESRSPSPVEKEYLQQHEHVEEDVVGTLKRKNQEYFRAIRSLEKERDEWQRRYQTHVRGHLTAQSLYERDLVRSRQAGATLLKMLNDYRGEKGDEPIELRRMSDVIPVDGEPIGTFRKQVQEHIELLKNLDEAFDAASPLLGEDCDE